MEKEELRRRIERSQDFDEIFEIVKEVVERDIGEHRAGLSLFLTDMPGNIGAYHPFGSNSIVVNRALIEGMKRVVRDPRELNYFVFTVLMHEYLHSLGHLDDDEVRDMVAGICRRSLGENSISVEMAKGNWLERHPELMAVGDGFSGAFEHVRKFDSSSTSYLG
ncbi:MAG: hypothetical protein JRN26_00560 [Nitrososphaerota archaeon]|jgi:hypothetical protein|nr:hypothetical protein [Nitrososphaerota archaeon]MDG6929750.1 hypothetical protein [Nitrososphaerota archaeon]MDG6931389.1 hypothetical protein [Nitrososphaerota archaeon]MDG6935372.1 hypothetical protein [Nitrososphaerota archaeon]MDG6944691.1 hypothetical protein [Nitrososphaerota archaeon]